MAGHRQPLAVHLLVHAMNQMLGNQGETVRYVKPIAFRPTDPIESLRDLAGDMNRREVEALVILGCNPVYAAPADFSFAEALQQVPHSFHLSLYENETSRRCSWHLPESHYLESWSDAIAFDGTASIVQPLIAPLYRGRSVHELVASLTSEQGTPGLEIVRSYWRDKLKQMGHGEEGFDELWQSALHDGLIRDTASPVVAVELQENWQAKIANDSKTPIASKAREFELVIDADPTIYDGRFATNGWLQELPKSFTKLTWDNAAILSPKTAKELGLKYESFAHGGEHGGYQVPTVALQVNGRQVDAPVWIMPGHADAAVTIYLGHGRKFAARTEGAWQQTLGFDAYAVRTSEHPWFASGLQITALDGSYPLACTQAHFLMNDRDIIRSATLLEYQENPLHAAAPKENGHEKPATSEEPSGNDVQAVQLRCAIAKMGDVDRHDLMHWVQCVCCGLPS